METHGFILIEGSLRLLAKDPIENELFTIGRLQPGEVIGFVSLLRQGPCEAAIARQPCRLISIPLTNVLENLNDKGLIEGLQNLESPCEKAFLYSKIAQSLNPPPENTQEWIKQALITEVGSETTNILSTSLTGYEKLVAEEVNDQLERDLSAISKIPIRTLKISSSIYNLTVNGSKRTKSEGVQEDVEKRQLPQWNANNTLDMKAIGLREASNESDLQGFKPIKGKGLVGTNLATLRMISRAYGTPCPIDVLERSLEAAFARTGSIPIHGMGELIESMGLQTQIGTIGFKQIDKLELPVLVQIKEKFILLTDIGKEDILLADPEKGWVKVPKNEASKEWGERVQVVLIKRLADTPKKTFGWSWFAPVIKRFQWPLVQVLLASLFIQLFQLANPLLIQQIIDKVINQSNLSALQVLGAALVGSALFQGLLTAVRTWLLIDTTDRMDILLGSQVIDKLLRLPLRFFEKRPVGELSQRLGELGTLRGFLTGTAITSTLDLLFATIYIFIMVMYSASLTAVALGTIPLYVIMILFIAPIYRRLIRKQAQYSARTQSHLIETLSGIQTVKAQHFELNSRWKWQERYSGQIAEGFKSVILGSSAGEIGNFPNQLSSLLIIWVGVYQVVNGEISLGQLIAFRIIAGYVTGPILRLSSLWQGFQQVGISMERLADIVDQIPEAGENDADQIALPSIKGKVKFENMRFRFAKQGPYQVDGVNLEIEPGSFVGIVGQSGSAKAHL